MEEFVLSAGSPALPDVFELFCNCFESRLLQFLLPRRHTYIEEGIGSAAQVWAPGRLAMGLAPKAHLVPGDAIERDLDGLWFFGRVFEVPTRG